jgi:hypothetical protein
MVRAMRGLTSARTRTSKEGYIMAKNGRWGHCAHCKHFGSPAAAPRDAEEANCTEPQLAKLELRVFGTCGCKRFELRQGLPESSERPRITA